MNEMSTLDINNFKKCIMPVGEKGKKEKKRKRENE
jgi:hypothetical protein